ncbi:MAG: polysaccharide deacetylase family protein [Bacteroidota bacterium]|nr:polysaccharide deacetylase family protein [Bacteroidota bacterium]
MQPNRFTFPAKNLIGYYLFIQFLFFGKASYAQQATSAFSWPEGKQAAVSLSFDDARLSQVDSGTSLLDQYQVKATFYVVPSGVEQRLEGWKKAVSNGHEIGNHSVNHPCTGNFPWARQKALEDYSLKKMRLELKECNRRIQELLGVEPEVFAYPCGQKFVGRGRKTKSYVPVVATLFNSGRGWLDEGPNDPLFCDPAQLTGIESDGKEFEEILPLLEEAKKTGKWVVLAGHEMGHSGPQTTRLSMLQKLLEYAQNPANGIWLAPVGTVGKYIQNHKKEE